MSRIQSFIRDLKHRRVFRTAAVYAVVAFMVAQAADLLMPGLLLPEWTYRLVVFLLVLGFPVAIVLSWAYDITPDGVRRAGDPDAPISPASPAARPATSRDPVGPTGPGDAPADLGNEPADPGNARAGSGNTVASRTTEARAAAPAHGRALGWAGAGILIGLVGFGGYAYLGPGSSRTGAVTEPAAGAVRHVIAVLPFTNLAGGEENEYFADGITEDLLMNLGLVPEFAVISRTSVMRYKGTDKSIPEIATELGAGYVLEGSLRRMGDQVRVVVQLIEPGTDTPIWASSLNRRLDDVFAIQAEIATAVVDALKVELAGGIGERIERAPTTDPLAYDLFLRAREEMRQGTAAAMEAGLDLYRQSIEKDPEFALGHAALGAAYALRYFNYGVDRSLLQSAFESARRAIALQPDLADGHRALGSAFLSSGRFAEAIPAFETAIELNPSDASAMNSLGLAHGMTGAWDQGLALARRALPHDPAQDYVILTNMGNYYRIMGLYEQARIMVHRSYQSRPDYWVTPYARAWLDVVEGRPEAAVDPLLDLAAAQPHPRILAGVAWVLMLAGAEAEAAPLLERVMAEEPDMPGRFNPEPSVLLAYLVHQAGDTDRAVRILDATERRVREIMAAGDANPSYPYSLAGASVVRGNHSDALDWLETAVGRGWNQLHTTRLDPLLAPLRGEPRFAAVVATMDGRLTAMRDRVQREGL